MLTGQTAFHAENYEGWARLHEGSPPKPPSTLRPELTDWRGLDALVLRLLAKEREDRPKDVAELLSRIDALDRTALASREKTIAEKILPNRKLPQINRSKRASRWIWAAVATVAVIPLPVTPLPLNV